MESYLRDCHLTVWMSPSLGLCPSRVSWGYRSSSWYLEMKTLKTTWLRVSPLPKVEIRAGPHITLDKLPGARRLCGCGECATVRLVLSPAQTVISCTIKEWPESGLTLLGSLDTGGGLGSSVDTKTLGQEGSVSADWLIRKIPEAKGTHGNIVIGKSVWGKNFYKWKELQVQVIFKNSAWVAGRTVTAGFRYFPEVFPTELIQWSSEGPKELCVGPIYFWKCWHRFHWGLGAPTSMIKRGSHCWSSQTQAWSNMVAIFIFRDTVTWVTQGLALSGVQTNYEWTSEACWDASTLVQMYILGIGVKA